MWRRMFQIAFGLAVGIFVRLLMPGHHSIGMIATIALSFCGALAGELAGEKLLPVDAVQQVGFVVSAIGALAVLLVYGIVA
ncbi:MAG TPA: hypothetical protein VM120_11975 [Bryobacteraceae bacterium]|nr:hypothetical protein [Bryobacteraceae bacterium]